MILIFKKEINGKPTHFETKILMHLGEDARAYGFYPKKLTIRDDPNNRWKAGWKIHFATGARTKNYVCFAMGKCTKVEGIVIVRTTDDKDVVVRIERRNDYLTNEEINQLAIDDGFESADAFLAFHLGKKRMVVKKIIHF